MGHNYLVILKIRKNMRSQVRKQNRLKNAKFKPVLVQMHTTRLGGGGGEGWFTQMFIPPSEVTWKSSGSFYFTKKERAKSELFLNSI